MGLRQLRGHYLRQLWSVTLNISEIELFKAANLWATKRCEEQGLSTDGSEKRRILGERIVKGIRFPVMTQHEFAAVALDCKILTPDEAFNIVILIRGTGNGERGTGNGERGTGNGERGTGNGSLGTSVQR